MKEKTKIETEQAIAMLPDGDFVHTFRNPAGILLGADWSRGKLIEAIKQYGAALAGEQARAMKHGLALHDGEWLFIETKAEQ